MNTKIITILIVISSLIWVLIWKQFFSKIQESKTITISELENQITNIVQNISPSVVNIVINKDLTIYRNDPFNFFYQPVWNISRKVWGGTWFFITKDGVIITNKHVVEDTNADYTVVLSDGKEYRAIILWLVPNNDIAIIKIDLDEGIFPLKFIDAYEWEKSDIKIWQFAIATWYALAKFQNSVSFWIISWVNRSIQSDWYQLSGLLQTDAAINQWNSGWPLINLEWKVMWINTAILWKESWIWFAIPLSQKYIDQLIKSIQ
jgi:serine protease Do